MSTELENCSQIEGEHEGTPMSLPSNCVMTLMIDVDVSKTADREVWGTGDLTYTVTFVNNSGEAVTDASLVDILDPDLIVYVADSVTVTIGGTPVLTPTVTYDTVSGKLTVELDTIADGETAVITFRVAKKTTP